MKRQIVKNKQEFVDWVNAFNGKMNCYTTVYDFKYYAETSKVDSSVIIDRMFLDFDAHGKPLDDAHWDFLQICVKLKDSNTMHQSYFSGNGFHIIVYGETVSDIRSIQQYYTSLAKDHPTLDRSGIQTNRLRRIPNTVNLSSDGPYYCIPLEVYEMNTPQNIRDLARTQQEWIPICGTKLASWPKVKPIEVSDIEIEAPKPPGEIPILPCLYNAIMVENPGHYARVYLAQWYRDILAMGERELPIEKKAEIVEIIMKEFETIASNDEVWLDWDEPTTRRYVAGIVDNGYHAPGCKTVLIPQGYCPGKCWRYCE